MMFVIDQQKRFACLRVREANSARILAVGCPAHSTLSRKIEVRQVEKMSEFFSRQPEDTKVMDVAPFQVKITFAPATDRSHPIPEHLWFSPPVT
jgi:hypothetical protein